MNEKNIIFVRHNYQKTINAYEKTTHYFSYFHHIRCC